MIKTVPRSSLSARLRKQVRKKTAGRCHVCGGPLGLKWSADHVLPRARGGRHNAANYLAACHICNRARWHWNSSLIRKILTLGVVARKEIRKETRLGLAMLVCFRRHRASKRTRRTSRRRSKR